ncbi:MAG: radical SAM protein [Lachnospiraceae bacterium]|nr:radical SAM protein [Lachnospiraceae bacterium]
METVWLIDATAYKKEISQELLAIKKDYFKIKAYARKQRIGDHVLPVQRTFSTGLLRIATLLHRIGYDVQYYHLNDFLEQNMAELAKGCPDIAAFGCVCPTVPICGNLAEKIKSRYPAAITVIGGAHVNMALNQTIKKFPCFDRYSFGYDKEAAGRVIGREINREIEDEPYVDYSILPYSLNEYDINIFTTLGCPFRCAYCQDGQMPYLEHRLDGGLGMIQEQLALGKLVHFFDSTLGYCESRLFEVCKALQALKHKFVLSCDIRAEFLTEKTLKALEDAGFREIRVGLEAADSRVLEKNNRKILPDTVMDKIKLVRKNSGLYLTLYTVSGLPGFTLETYRKNQEIYRYLLETRSVDEIKNAQYVPYPRDNMDLTGKGIIWMEDKWENYDRQSYPVYETKELTRQQIWEGFLDTARTINRAWLKGWGLGSVDELGNEELYPEYIVSNYLGKKV